MEWKKQEGSNFWSPDEVGQEIEGNVTDIRDDDQFGRQYSIATKDGKIVLPSHKVLQNRMLDAKIGTIVKVVFKGEEPPKLKGHKPTKLYEVFFGE